MNTNLTPSNPQRNRIHPLVAGAAVAVILASATGIAAMTGLLPTSHAVTEPAQPVTTAAAQVASLFYLVPPATAVIAYLMFDERLGVLALAGMVVTAMGVALVNRRPQAARAKG